MGKHNEYFVVPRKDGRWAVELPHAERASAVEDSQKRQSRLLKSFCRKASFTSSKPTESFDTLSRKPAGRA